jgi:hypothetical protein
MTQEQQIEAMAYVLCGGCNECYHSLCADWYRAERLYKAGYRKQSEAEWISASGKDFGSIYDNFYCSNCRDYTQERNPYRLSKYCPNCGAKMKLHKVEDNNETN